MSKRSFWKMVGAAMVSTSALVDVSHAQQVVAGEELLISVAKESDVVATAGISPVQKVRNAGRHVVARLAQSSKIASFSSARVSFSQAQAACREYIAQHPGSECEPNVTFHATATPNDSYWAWTSGMRNISAPQAWDSITGSTGILVAVIDTGVDYEHSDLSKNIAINSREIAGNRRDDDGNGYVDDVYGYDFAAGDGDPMDLNGHGTHVAGTIGARGNDGEGVAGVNWRASVLPVRVLDANGSGSLAQVIAGIDYAVARGARVINLSLGAPYGSKLLLESLERASSAGVVIVAAAGNDGIDNDIAPSFPANYELDTLISVAATDSDDNVADFSNYGAVSVHLAAPGVSILSTYLFDSHVFLSGTSMATPHVAGAATLLLGVNPSLTGAQVKDILLNTVDVLPQLSGVVSTGGRLNLARAVASAFTGRTPDGNNTPAMGSIAIDLSLRALKGGRHASFQAEVYSLNDAQSVGDVAVELVCGRRTVARASSDAEGKIQFRRVARDAAKSKSCFVIADYEGMSIWSNPVTLRAIASGRNRGK